MDIASGVARQLDDDLYSALEQALAQHEPRRVDISERRKAAVLIPLFERGDEPWVVLTKRTEHVATHKGQISFPGGAHDDTDPDLWTTAVREAEEEIGLPPDAARLIGTLDDLPTFSSGFIVSPFVASIEPPNAWVPHDAEVDAVIELPLRRLADAARTETWEREGIRFPMHIFEVDGHYVWGVTAFILHRFLELVGPVLGYGDRDPTAEAEAIVRELAASDDRFDWTGIYWVEGEDLVLGPYVGTHPDGHETIRIPEGVCGAVAAGGVTEVVPDVRARPGHIACDLRTRSEVVVPIRLNGRVVGVLDVDSNTPDAFGPAEVRAIEDAAARISRG